MPRSTAATTRWLDDVEMRAWRNYVESVHLLQPVLEKPLLPFGLDMGDYEVLVRLSEHEGRQLRMCDLAEQLQLSPSGLTRRLDGLVRAGHVTRVPSDNDRRVMLARLTPSGYALLVKAAPSHVDSVREHFLDLLSRREVEALASAFSKLATHLAEQQTAEP
jgi:DNA-binding MarR family transcriptional regulator